jgi:hypothetical protein
MTTAPISSLHPSGVHLVRLLGALALAVLGACGSSEKQPQGRDAASTDSGEADAPVAQPGPVDSSSVDGDRDIVAAHDTAGEAEASLDGGGDAGATFFADGPVRGWVGGNCAVNRDCAKSPAAVENSKYGCVNEVYCLAGVCHGDCSINCEQVRIDINPCPAPRICTALPGSGINTVCKITPIPCVTAATCPQYTPKPEDGGVGDWSCVDGICRYPGFDYPTQ